MKTNWLRTLASSPSLRIGLAVILIIVGLAPIGVPILSDSSWRAVSGLEGEAATPAVQQPQAFVYRTDAEGDNMTRVERSDDRGRTWYAVASIPAKIVELVATPGDEQVVYGRGENAIWISRDGGTTWVVGGQLPSRPLSLAVTSTAAGTVLAGTESVGLAISRDGGGSWQVVDDPALTMGGAAPIAVTALEINPQDETIVYATTAVWTGTSAARQTPVGTFVSVDGGRLWLQMDVLPFDGGVGTRIDPVTNQPLTVLVENSMGVQTQKLELSQGLLDELNNEDARVRSSVARILGLLGDRSAVRPLMDRLYDPDVLVGDRVAEALGRLEDVSAAPALVTALESSQEAVRARAGLGSSSGGAPSVGDPDAGLSAPDDALRARIERAQAWLQAGDQAARNGDTVRAREYWTMAATEAPGSQAALEAQTRLGETSASPMF